MDPEIDQEPIQDDPNGQPLENGNGNDQEKGIQSDNSPTDFIEVKGVKIPASEFEQLAKEKYKDRFEAFENREKWQKSNTEKAAQLKESIRKAELFDRMLAEGRFNQHQPQNSDPKREYVEKKLKLFPDVDPRFFESQFEDIQQLAEMKSRELVDPIYARSGEEYERKFLESHPRVTKGSVEYQKIAKLMGAGVDAEEAYQLVFQKELLEEQLKLKTEEAIKARDEEAKRKLKQSRTTSGQSGTVPKSKNFSDRAWSIIHQMKD